ncbi:MAG: polyprenyl synthetase family protein [Minisyncoccota bacterium]
MSTGNPLETVGAYGARVDAPAEALLKRSDYAMYGMMRYFMGYTDEHFHTSEHAVGKRFRPGLLLCIADGYGVLEEALPAALSIELFHNFTLIHDDIVDHDELRRGRPTVWKLWGVDHAINTGDAQLILALRALEDAEDTRSESHAAVRKNLLDRYLEVTEGQFLDFSLAAAALRDESVSEEAYLTMTAKKTAKLIRAATETAALIAKRSEAEVSALGDFGENLGMAYQLYDDWQSIWGTPEKTGKKRAGDILERKKTLPALYAYEHLGQADKQRLEDLYGSGEMDEAGVSEVLDLFMKVDAQDVLKRYAAQYKEKALQTLARIEADIPSETKALLEQTVRTLIPDSIIESR